jgi:hypothetical protein
VGIALSLPFAMNSTVETVSDILAQKKK